VLSKPSFSGNVVSRIALQQHQKQNLPARIKRQDPFQNRNRLNEE
jgi:hypothetical protein